jgi:thiamine biosynthesis lipoprotein
MTSPAQPRTPADRDRAKVRLRVLTRSVIVAATGATVAIGIVVAQDHPGADALAADRAAARIADAIGTGALVSLGGDVAVAGRPPPGGWAIGIARESSTPPGEADQVVAIHGGGLASSGTAARTWRAGDRTLNHIIDPRRGECVEPYWQLVSATGASCVEANLVTTAAHVWGGTALDRVPRFGQAVRLVRADGRLFFVNGWPEPHAA